MGTLNCGFYGQRGIRIATLLSDNEKGITSLGLQLNGARIQLVQVGPTMHVPEAERDIRVVKEITRATVHGLPYNCPLAIFAFLPVFATSRMAIFCSSTRPHDLTPFQIIYGRPFNAKIDGQLEFGSYCQVSNSKMSNSMDARTIGAIAIGQLHNGAGICRFYSLLTGKTFTADHFKVLPMNDDIIARLNAMALKDKHSPTREPVFRFHDLDLLDSIPLDTKDTPEDAPAPAYSDNLPTENLSAPLTADPMISSDQLARTHSYTQPMRIEPPHEEDLPHRNVRGDYRTDNNEGSESVEDPEMPELQEV